MEKIKIIKSAWTSPTEYLCVGTEVYIMDENVNDEKALVLTMDGYKKLVDKECLEYKGDKNICLENLYKK